MQPTDETDFGAGNGAEGASGDAYSNLAIDFGFVSATLGGHVFNDSDNDGLFNNTNTGFNNITVELYTDTNADGDYDSGTDAFIASTTTNTSGAYEFRNIPDGEYIVVIPSSQFGAAQTLEDYVSSTGDLVFGSTAIGLNEPPPDPDNNTDNDDNGGAVGADVATFAVTITNGSEPTNDGDTDASTNYSIDLGFFIPQFFVTVGLDDNTIDLGVLNTALTNSGLQTYTLDTNNPAGALLYFFGEATGLDDGGGNDINLVSDGTVSSGSEEYGLGVTSSMVLIAPFTSGDEPPPTTSTNFVTTSGSPVTNETVDFTYKASIDSTSRSGKYDQIITVTVLANP